MKLYGLIIAVGVLAVLTGLLVWSNRHQPALGDDGGTVSTAVPQTKIVAVNSDDIQKIDIKRKDQPLISLVRDGSGQWQMTAPKPLPASYDGVHDILVEFSALNADRTIDEKATDLTQYGLGPEPLIEVDLAEKDNKSQKVLIGDDSPTGATVYAELAGDPRVFTVTSYVKTTVSKSADDLRDRSLLHIEAGKVDHIELTAKNQTIELEHRPTTWEIVKPKIRRADPTQMDALLNNLSSAKFDNGGADHQAENAAAFASGTPVGTVRLTTGAKTVELQVRKNKDNYYAKTSEFDGAYKVEADLGPTVNKGLDDLEAKALFQIGLGDPDEEEPGNVSKVEIRDGATSDTLTRSGMSWSKNGQLMDPRTVMYLLQAISSLTATDFVDSGYTQPVLEITVTTDDGNVQKASFSKNGKTYVAKRQDDPALYEVDAAAVSAFQEAEGKVQPVPAPK